MKPTSVLSALVTVLAAALIGFAPMASRAADYTPDYPDKLKSGPGNNSALCATDQSPALADCAITGMDRATNTTSLMQTVGRDYEQVDASSVLLELLVKTGPDRFLEDL